MLTDDKVTELFYMADDLTTSIFNSASILTPKWKNTVSVTPGSVVAIVPAGYLSPK